MLTPNHDIIAAIAGQITSFIAVGGYLGVAALMAIESACVPLPSEIIMPFAGYLVSSDRFSLLAVATAGAIGCNIGSIPPYELGRRGGRSAILRWGKYVLVTRNDLERAERFFSRFGGAAVLIGRMLPLIRSFIAFPAGMARMSLMRFHLYTFAGSWPWCFALALLGDRLGKRWNSDPRMASAFHTVDVVVAAVGCAGLLFFVVRRLIRAHKLRTLCRRQAGCRS